MRLMWPLAWMLALAVAAPAGANPSFDCGTARLPAELTICRVVNLGDADAAIAKDFGEILSVASEAEKSQLRSEQRAWLQRRNACRDDIGCLLTVMSERRLALGRKHGEMRPRMPSWSLFKPSFTCTERSKDVEKAICGDKRLAEYDLELVAAYADALKRVGAQGADELKTAQRAWVAKRNGCGSDGDCISTAMKDRIAELENTLGPAPIMPTPAVKSAAECSSDAAILARAARAVSVTLRHQGAAKAGQPIPIAWRRGDWNLPRDTSLHLVLTMPEWVRFSGKYLLPLPPRAPAPAGLTYGLDKLRVVLPLTSETAPRSDELAVKVYQAGPFRIAHALIAKSSCGETVVTSGQLPEVSVEAGAPEIVMQDFYTLEKPERTIISNNGRYRLEVFPGSYRVFDIATGVKIADRVGVEPNFSPEARFVGAYSTSALEIFDVLCRTQVDLSGATGSSIGWAMHDGVLITGATSDNVSVATTLVDPMPSVTADAETTWQAGRITTSIVKGYPWAHHPISIFPSQALVLVYNTIGGFKIFDLASGKRPQADSIRLGEGKWPQAYDVRRALLALGISNFDGFKGWHADGPIRLSHIDEDIEFGVAGAESRFKGAILPSSRLVRHGGTTPPVAGFDESQRMALASADWRSRTASASLPLMGDTELSRFAERLSEFGICVDQNCRGVTGQIPIENFVASSTFNRQANFVSWDHVAKFTRPASELQVALAREVPIALTAIAAPEEDTTYHEWPDDSDRSNRLVRFRLTEEPVHQGGANGLWRWSFKGQISWVTQQVYGWRGGLNASSVVMYLGDLKGRGKIVNLSAADRASYDADGLHKTFLGWRSDQLVRVRPFLYADRWLLVAAPAGSSAAVVDLERPEPPTFMYGLKDVHDTRYLLRTHDGRQLVQLNTDGRFHVYEIPSGKTVVSGRYIDDEIILFTPEGYFWSSYEGAHYVHLKFAGRDGLHSLQQFARVLDRPDLVKAAIAGGSATRPEPNLRAPPSLDIAMSQSTDAKIELAVKASSAAGLKELRVYHDGRPTDTVPVSGASFESTIAIHRQPQARWLTLVAVDASGLTSVPVTAPLDAPPRKVNTLHLLAVGVDEYDHLSRLGFARTDAEALVGASNNIKGGYYAKVQASLLRDREATGDRILQVLEAKVAEAGAGDTLMLFFAGHGARSPDGRFFMTTSTTRADDLDGTALEWSRLATVLGRANARVIVLLDACHSGQTGAQLQATNDDAVAAISESSRTPMLIIAASKGRQFSKELPGAGGGVFTQGLAKLITQGRDEQDLNRNGVLEVSEIFRGLKDVVTRVTNGSQTPWLVRQEMVGDFAVF
ncbi:MAG: hypothetical protein CTY20_04330 [Hyphomicrobium sp.]|nr:MAG: hypothetical protein CTY20_04330 [Hyphomicrobium sp.]